MLEKERSELAADIARRVRLMSWQPMPAELADALNWNPGGWTYHTQIPMAGPNYISLRFTRYAIPHRLELEWQVNDTLVARQLWTPENAIR